MKPKLIRVTMFLPLMAAGLLASAQARYSSQAIDLTVSGTSTLHDWTMKSIKAEVTGSFAIDGGQIKGVDGLVFSTPATALKSDHTSMDNNAYKALKTEKNPTITYTATNATVAQAEGGGSVVTCNGKLNIAGSTRDVQIVALCKINSDNTITVTGTEKISMKEFSIDPPTFMMGTIKTGNEILLAFHLTLRRA